MNDALCTCTRRLLHYGHNYGLDKLLVKPLYKGHSREPRNVSFTYRLKLYALFIKSKNETGTSTSRDYLRLDIYNTVLSKIFILYPQQRQRKVSSK